MHAVVQYFNQHKKLPIAVDFSQTFAKFKDAGLERTDVYRSYFQTDFQKCIAFSEILEFPLFSLFDYREEQHKKIVPFVQKYFFPSDAVLAQSRLLQSKYELNLENVITVCYRGTDKWKDTGLGAFDDFVFKAKEILSLHPGLTIVVQTDQRQFIEYCREHFERFVWFAELPVTETASPIHDVVSADKVAWASRFLAAIFLLARSRYLVIHTGNVGRWLCLYRGNASNVHQFIKPKGIDSGGSWLSDTLATP